MMKKKAVVIDKAGVKKGTDIITDYELDYCGAPSDSGAVYANPGYGFLCVPRSITERLVAQNYIFKAIPHNAARADSEKFWVLMMALFRRCTLCTSRKSDEIRAQIFRKMPQAYCAVLP